MVKCFCRQSELSEFEFPWGPFSTGQCLAIQESRLFEHLLFLKFHLILDDNLMSEPNFGGPQKVDFLSTFFRFKFHLILGDSLMSEPKLEVPKKSTF